MSDQNSFPSPATPAASARRRDLAIGIAAVVGAALAGAALSGFASRTAALAFADWLDLGRAVERLAFASAMGAIGGAAGGALGLWLMLSRLARAASMIRLAAAGFAAVAFFSVALGYVAFAVTTPPPPVQPFLILQLRLDGLGWSDVAITGAGGRAAIPAEGLQWRVDTYDVTTADAVLPMLEPSGMRAIILARDGREIARFSLDLPGDPPATARYSHWLTPDRRQGATPGIEMRFRIERRIVR
ncbi:MAG: hypothetical protein Q8O26_07795 [Phreatobacter sp.]|uniref:hypothetical protein n=1 Tax=Phreatobacter sp. TaxID=1966341 RepID=UPI0027372C84|nr:hypothetical protein [Phreatobacter sp.]MDP2801772.1 hypothetical protein [Phreatobacter sp.]